VQKYIFYKNHFSTKFIHEPKLSALIHSESHFYMARGQFLTRLTIQGNTNRIALNGASAKKMVASSELFTFRLIVATDKGCLLYRPTKDVFNPCGIFFATEEEVQSMCFLKNHLLIAFQNRIQLYSFDDEDNTPKLINQQKINKNIVSIHPGKTREECLILTKFGYLVSYHISDH
jgi:hypothetical protein